WFEQPIPPNNVALNLTPSYLLRDLWKYPTDQMP
ncbi:MAG: amino acid ABC transporter substrate-binding protein, partial [Hydrogenophaga sp.]|nr:amino acid ABC transporter substrate-binding protein [Hydrogenophaga sp.]